MRSLYPATEALDRRSVAVGAGHCIDVRQFGRADGIAALVLHGGPGSATSPLLWRVFDPARYRVICFDQRGCGASRPRGETAHNSTDELLDDIEHVRRLLGIGRWLVVGGSWGAALALAHAAAQPQAVSGLLLRSAFLARRADIDWFFQGARVACPQAWERFAAMAPPAQRATLLQWLQSALADADPARRHTAALAWWEWEQALARCAAPGSDAEQSMQSAGPLAGPLTGALAGVQIEWPTGAQADALVDRYRIQSHYLVHGCFFDAAPLLERCARLPQVPTLLVHGTGDRVCRPCGAQALQAALPQLALRWLDGVGHDAAHPAMVGAMVEALDRFATHADFAPA